MEKITLQCFEHDYSEYRDDIYTTGDWAVDPKRWDLLVGKDVILYENNDKAAYLGGKIIAVVDRGLAKWKRGNGNPRLCSIVFRKDNSLTGFTGHIGKVKGTQNVQYI